MNDQPHRALPPLTLSFMGANFVGRELGYGVADEWGPYDEATNAAFEPLASYGDRIDDVFAAIAAAGFDALDLWLAHLNWRWATPEHIRIARDSLDRHGLRVVSLAGNLGATSAELESACSLANALDVDLLGGGGDVLRNDLPGAVTVLRDHGVRFGYENHPEKTPREVLALIGDADDVLGAAVDTGWWATQGFDPVQALRDLDGRLFHVHLKDVEAPGTHISCMHGEGCAEIAACVDALLDIGYQGALSVEHEPYDRDPTEEIIQMRAVIETRLTAAHEAAHV
jgi:sugar phosphate isomerase/epimerase